MTTSNLALLCRLRYFNLMATSIERMSLSGYIATSLTNIHSAAKFSQLPGNLVGSLNVLKGFRHLKILSLLHLSKVTGFPELVTAAPKLHSLELVDCKELSGELDDASVIWLTNIRDKRVSDIGPLSMHGGFSGAHMTTIDLCHVSSLTFTLNSFKNCANVRELRLRGCDGLSGTLQALMALKDTLEVLDLDGCGGGGEGVGRGGGYLGEEDAATSSSEVDDSQRGKAKPWGGRGPEGPIEVLALCTKLRWIHLCGCGGISGILSAGAVKLISDIRRERGRSAVNMMGVGLLTLEDDLEDEAALGMVTIDLSEIPSIDGSVTALYECVNLCELHFEYTALRGSIDDLHTITGLVVCDLSDCQHICGSLSMFESMPLLEELDLRRCHAIEGTLDPLTACVRLKELLLSNCPGISGILSAAIVALISNIRHNYGQSAVDLRGCGKFVLLDFDYDSNDTEVDDAKAAPVLEQAHGSSDSTQSPRGEEDAKPAIDVAVGETEMTLSTDQVDSVDGDEGSSGDHQEAAPAVEVRPFDKHTKSAIAFKNTHSIDLGNIPSLTGNVSVLAECPSLQRTCRHLCLAQCPLVSGSLRALQPLEKLEAILVGGCKELDCSDAFDHFGSWAASQRLETVGLGGTNAAGPMEPLKALVSVKILDLSLCQVNGSLEHLEPCKQLEFLNLTDCPKLRGVDKFVRQHPYCEIMSGTYKL